MQMISTHTLGWALLWGGGGGGGQSTKLTCNEWALNPGITVTSQSIINAFIPIIIFLIQSNLQSQ